MSRVLAVTWLAKPGEEQRIEQILRTLTELSRAEPGCIQFQAARSIEDPRRFLLFEVYKDSGAVQAHTESDHFKRYVTEQASPLLDARERATYESLD